MTDTFVEDGTPTDESPNIKQLREKAKHADELQARLDEMEAKVAHTERRDAFAEAGLDTTKGPGKLLMQAYEGDNTPEAIKAAALEYGVIQPEADEVPPENGTQVRQELADGASADTGVKPDPNEIALKQFNENMTRGLSEEAAAGQFIGRLAEAAHEGDPRVVWEPTQR